jgi:hypothetical protein
MYSDNVFGEKAAKQVAAGLVDSSQWFEFTPLPDGYYEFRVKQENTELLKRLIQE